MKINHFFPLLLVACLLTGKTSYQQGQALYQVPDSYSFDYEVVQVSINKKNAADSTVMHYLYTKSGNYAGLRFGGSKGGRLIVFTKDGASILFDDDKKNITIMNMRKMLLDLANTVKGMNKDSLTGRLKEKIDAKKIRTAKTGNTKQISGYTADEYIVSDSGGHKASVWYAKVDFNTQLYYILGMGADNLLKMTNSPVARDPLVQALAEPKTLLTEIDAGDSRDGKGMAMHTRAISKTVTSISTKGYEVKNYSNMSFKEIMQAESKKKSS